MARLIVRTLPILLMLFCGRLSKAQAVLLETLEKWDTIPRGKAVVYGTFLQSFSKKAAGGQYIDLLNKDTKKVYSMPVLTRTIASEVNHFILVLPPGQYLLVRYRYILYSPYVTALDRIAAYKKQLCSDTLSTDSTNMNRITFTVGTRTLNYVGTWDFRETKIVFEDKKTEADPVWKKYKKLDFSKAVPNIPAPTQGFIRP